jgi:hypothetical protein
LVVIKLKLESLELELELVPLHAASAKPLMSKPKWAMGTRMVVRDCAASDFDMDDLACVST